MKQTSTALAVLIILLLSPPAGAGEPRLTADAALAAAATAEEPMDVDVMIEISLIASGVPVSDRPAYAASIRDLTEALPPSTGDVALDGEAILQWMHEGLLTRYVEPQTRIDVLLDRGTYNCVSSAVLYMILARSAGIPVYGVQTADHAFCRVPDAANEDGGYDVETTIAYGFDPGRRHDAVDTFSGRTGFVYVPPSNYRSRTDIGEKELIALIYQNRIAALQRSRKWTEALGLARDRWELAGHEAAKRDFIVSLDNYAAEMNRRNTQETALVILLQAADLIGDGAPFHDSAKALLHNAVTLKLRAGKIEEARTVLADTDNTALVGREDVANLSRSIEQAALDQTVKEADFLEAAAAVDAAFQANVIPQDRWEQYIVYLWSEEARRRSRGGNWLEGWRFVTEAPDAVGSLLDRKGVTDTYAYNAVVVYHNEIVSHLRAGRLDEAEALLREAESLFPGDSTLAKDRRSLEQMRSRQ